jgi:hypothetical protein
VPALLPPALRDPEGVLKVPLRTRFRTTRLVLLVSSCLAQSSASM